MMFDFLQNKSVLVTGASGLVGFNLIEYLLSTKLNVKIFAMGRSLIKLERTFQYYIDDPRLSLIEHNIALPLIESNLSSSSLFKYSIDYVFHAASPVGALSEGSQIEIINANIVGTINCCEFLLKQSHNNKNESGKLIILSSFTVYGNFNTDKIIDENETLKPIMDRGLHNAIYSNAKISSELIAKSYHDEHEMKFSIARLGSVYGYVPNGQNTTYYSFINQALNDEDIVIHSESLPDKDNIYVQDVVNGILTIAEKGLNCEAYNVTTNGECGNFASLYDYGTLIADTINRECGKKIKCIFNKSITQPRITFANNKLKGLGWNVKFTFIDGLTTTIKKSISSNISK